MQQQIFIVHGGETFETYDEYWEFLKNYRIDLEKIKHGGWKDGLQENLGNCYDVIYPRMENYHNAKYLEWKIYFEKFFPFFQDGIILIGGSLGGVFLAKYLSENEFPVKIKAVFLVAAPFGYKKEFSFPESLEKFDRQVPKIFIYQSEDDPVVPLSDAEEYANCLSNAEKIIFKDRGHFNQREFPEIVEKIKSI